MKQSILSDKTRFQEYLVQIRRNGRGEYQLPYRRFDVPVAELYLEDMKVFVLNGKQSCRGRMLYFHGGGYLLDPMVFHLRFLNILARETDWEIWLPIYPKVPCYQAQDVYPLLMRLYVQFVEADTQGAAFRTAFMGDSAGGGLALGLLQDLVCKNLPAPENILLLSPWLDVTMCHADAQNRQAGDVICTDVLREAGRLWAGGWDLRDYRVSPLYGAFDGLKHIFLCSGTEDLLHSDSERLCQIAAAKEIGVRYLRRPGLGHLYTLLTAKGLKIDLVEILTFMKMFC